jgi:hypothetical protein
MNHAQQVNALFDAQFNTCSQAHNNGARRIELRVDPPLPPGTVYGDFSYRFNDGSIIQLPGYTIPADVHLFRGTNLRCEQFNPRYNFDAWATWWFWTYDAARMYAPRGQGCIGEYNITEPLRLVDFWNFRTIILLEYIANNNLVEITPRERTAFYLYTGRTIEKPNILLTALENDLLDANDPTQALDTPFWTRDRPPIPDAWQFQHRRCIKWGPDADEFDHSSTRTLDQEMSRFISRVFLPQNLDGVMVPFEVPSSMHRKRATDIGDIHSEIFLFPDTRRPRPNRVGAFKLDPITPHQQGGRKKTRKQKKTKSKTFKKKKSMPK